MQRLNALYLAALARCNAICDWCAGTYLDETLLLIAGYAAYPHLLRAFGLVKLLLFGLSIRCFIFSIFGLDRWLRVFDNDERPISFFWPRRESVANDVMRQLP